MAIDFPRSTYTAAEGVSAESWPASPSNGDTQTNGAGDNFTFNGTSSLWVLNTGRTLTLSGGATYSWDGEKWIAQSHIPFRYFGPQASDPTGMSASDEGDLYYNTVENEMRVYNGSSWDTITSVGDFNILTLSASSTAAPVGGTASFNGTATRFQLSETPNVAQQLLISINGVVQEPQAGTSPTVGFAVSGSDIIFAAAPATGSAFFGVQMGATVNIGTPSDNTVTNAKVATNAAIAGTKISPNFGSQDIVTTGNVGIGASNNSSYDSIAQNLLVADESGNTGITIRSGGSTPFGAIHFADGTGSNAEKRAGRIIYQHAIDTLSFVTAHAEAMRIDSSGKVGIKTTSPSSYYANDLVVTGSSEGGITIDGPTTGQSYLAFADGTSGNERYRGYIAYDHATDSLKLASAVGERLRIDSAGRVGIGSGSQDLSVFNANGSRDLVVYSKGTSGSDAHAGITLLGQSTTASQCSVTFADGASGTSRYAGSIDYFHSNDSLNFRVNTSSAMRIDSAHRVMLGVTSSAHTYRKLQIVGKYTDGQRQGALLRYGEASSNGPVLTFEKNRSNSGGTSSTADDDNLGEIHFQGTDQGGSYRPSSMIKGVCDATPANNTTPGRLQFYTAPVGTSQSPQVRMTIDSSGRLLVGTSTAFGSTSSELLQVANANGGKIGLLRDDASIGTGNEIGVITWYSADGSTQPTASIACQADADHAANDKPGRLVFSTTQDNASSVTERMKLDREGVLSHNSSSHGVQTCLTASAGTSTFAYRGLFNTSAGLYAGTVSYIVWSNGNVENTNNSYGSISDVKLKENIVDANSQWNDIKQLQVRNYNFKEDTGLETHKQLGLIAQEAETVSPGLVYETADVGDDGEELGTVTKKLNYSVLYMKAVKALQEAMTRIETLETKIATLEAK